MSLLRRLRHWLGWRTREAEISEELEFHRSMVQESLERSGLSSREALLASRRTLGNATLAREDARAVWLWPSLEGVWQDVRYGVRVLKKNAGFATVVVLTLALGIGANTVVFSIVNGVLLRPLAAERIDELARVVWSRPDNAQASGDFSWPNYVDLRDQTTTFGGLAAHAFTWVAFDAAGLRASNETADVIFGELVTDNYFDVLGITPTLGRAFSPSEAGVPNAAPVVVVSHSLWQRKFGGDPALPGRTVHLNGRPFTIVGIAPFAFKGTKFPLAVDFWTPVMMRATLTGSRDWMGDRNQAFLSITGRLKPDATREQATSDLDGIWRGLASIHPDTNAGTSVRAVAEAEGRLGEGYRPARFGSLVALLLASLVLLVTCANVANLLAGRALARSREIGIRLALGAGRWRVVRQLLTESLLLAGLGGALATVLTYAGARMIRAAIPAAPPAVQDFNFAPDGRVFAWALAVSIVTGIVFGLAPAVYAARIDLISVTKPDAVPPRRTGRAWWRIDARDFFVGIQVAVSVIVLVCAGLFLRSLRNAEAVDPGFRSDRLVSMMLSPGLLQYSAENARRFYAEVERRVESMPGIRAASISGGLLLLTGGQPAGPVVRAGDPQPLPNQGMTTITLAVGPEYFETMGTRLIHGRAFTDRDHIDAPAVAIVNQEFARRVFGDERRALGGRFRFGDASAPDRQVVGIVPTGKYESLYESPQPCAFVPVQQRAMPHDLSTAFVVASAHAGDLAAIADEMRQEVRRLDPRVPVTTVRMADDHLSVAFMGLRFGSGLATAFGVLVLVLATMGVHSVMSYAVRRRTREIGIRLALGAEPREVVRVALQRAMIVVAAAVLAGLSAALAAGRALSGALLDVSPSDPVTFGGIALLLGAAAFAAAYVPAKRAAGVDAAVALRQE